MSPEHKQMYTDYLKAHPDSKMDMTEWMMERNNTEERITKIKALLAEINPDFLINMKLPDLSELKQNMDAITPQLDQAVVIKDQPVK